MLFSFIQTPSRSFNQLDHKHNKKDEFFYHFSSIIFICGAELAAIFTQNALFARAFGERSLDFLDLELSVCTHTVYFDRLRYGTGACEFNRLCGFDRWTGEPASLGVLANEK